MNVLILSANPNPKSFNSSIVETLTDALTERGHAVRHRDLYRTGYKTILDQDDMARIYGKKEIPEDILNEQREVDWAQGLVFVYPVWWFGPPAILKGWVDRTFQNGWAFSWGKDGTRGLLKHERALVIQTAGEKYAPGSLQENLVKLPMTMGVLEFCGIRNVDFKIFYSVPHVSESDRQAMLGEVRELAKKF